MVVVTKRRAIGLGLAFLLASLAVAFAMLPLFERGFLPIPFGYMPDSWWFLLASTACYGSLATECALSVFRIVYVFYALPLTVVLTLFISLPLRAVRKANQK
jgi:hypothetical protein